MRAVNVGFIRHLLFENMTVETFVARCARTGIAMLDVAVAYATRRAFKMGRCRRPSRKSIPMWIGSPGWPSTST